MNKLATAIIVPLVGALLIAVVGGWLLRQAWADSAIELKACSKKTCASMSEADEKALGYGSVIYFGRDQIIGVASIPGCDECSRLRTKSGQTVFVVGKPDTLSCVIFGGSGCSRVNR